MPEENEVVIEETIVAAEETTQELVPVMAQRCTTTYYRYGDSYDPRDIDMEIKNGYLTTTCGISVNTNPNIAWLIDKYGPAQSVNYIPSGLYFYHTSGTHYVIAPAYQMTENEYIALCKLIR